MKNFLDFIPIYTKHIAEIHSDVQVTISNRKKRKKKKESNYFAWVPSTVYLGNCYLNATNKTQHLLLFVFRGLIFIYLFPGRTENLSHLVSLFKSNGILGTGHQNKQVKRKKSKQFITFLNFIEENIKKVHINDTFKQNLFCRN